MNLGRLDGLFCLECGRGVMNSSEGHLHLDGDQSHNARIAEEVIKVNGVVKIVRQGDWIYKRQPSFLCENEFYCLQALAPYGIVPESYRVDLETIRMRFIEEARVIDWLAIRASADNVLGILEVEGIRHGDLTRPNIRLLRDRIILLDFSESRLACDPRVDKRPEGDKKWLLETVESLKLN